MARTGALRSCIAFIRLGRPLFLGGGLVLYALGAAAAAATGHAVDVTTYAWGQLAVTALQLMTHYANDYFDFDADCANQTFTRWSGGSRILPGGHIPRSAALVAALVLAAIGLGAGWVLQARAPGTQAWPGPLAHVLAMAVLSWIYSAPPLRLHSRGWGELDVAVVVTGLVPLLGFVLQAPDHAGLRIVLLGLWPLCCLQFAMVMATEFPDHAGDRAVGKRTLVVRLGPARAARLFALATAAAYVPLPLLFWAGLPASVALAAALVAVLALWRIWRVRAGDCVDPARWESLTFWSVALLVATATAEAVAFVVLSI
jgi:1,4-dihydroxy-2-naphthoate octaprenyltransferase